MATIPREALEYVTREINGVSAQAQRQVMRVLERIDWSDVEKARELVVQAVQMALSNATTLAAQASADLYDAVREASIGSALGTQPISGYEPEKTEKAVRSFVRFIVDGRPETFDDQVLQRMDYEIKRASNNAIVANGRNDPAKPKYARVPTGAETCDFCLMLASRGFVYRSESTAAIDHTHANCDCRAVPGFPGDEVEGYDPGSIYDAWQERIREMAAERAERHGTSEKEELAKIMSGYAEAARNAKRRSRTA